MTTTTNNNVIIGTLINGTLRNEDLLDAFAGELELLDPGYWNSPVMRSVVLADSGGEAASDMIQWLIDALNEHAPPHTYFGSVEGDGADFGFWPTGEPFELCDTINTPDGWWDRDCQVYVEINDHGNVTVSDINHDEIWSAV